MCFRCPNISGSISGCCHVGLLLLVGSCPWFLMKNANKPVQIVTIKNKFLSILHPDESVQTSSNKRVHQLYNCQERTSEQKRKNCHFFNPSQFLSQFDTSFIHSKSDTSKSSNKATNSTDSLTTDYESNNDSIEETPVVSDNNDFSMSISSISMSANESEASVTYPSQESLLPLDLSPVETQESGRHQTLSVGSDMSGSNKTDNDSKSCTSSQTSYYGRSGVDTSKKKFNKTVLAIPPKSNILGM